jgi:ketosteroid isomerase-like protein
VETAHVWTFRDGKATTFQQHTDTAMIRALS